MPENSSVHCISASSHNLFSLHSPNKPQGNKKGQEIR